jgi:hypothetical protein
MGEGKKGRKKERKIHCLIIKDGILISISEKKLNFSFPLFLSLSISLSLVQMEQ